jgi:hypothetical protein
VGEIEVLIKQDPSVVSMKNEKGQTGLIFAMSYLPGNNYSVNVITDMTDLLSTGLSKAEMLDAMTEFTKKYNAYSVASESMQPFTLCDLIAIGKILVSKVKLVDMPPKVVNLIDVTLVNKEQITNEIRDLMEKAKKTEKKSTAVDYLTKARLFNSRYLSGDSNKNLEQEINGTATAVTDTKDKELLSERMKEYLGKAKDKITLPTLFPASEDGSYELLLGKMVEKLLSVNCVVQGDKKEALLSKIMLGTMKRDFGLLYRVQDIDNGTNIRSLLVLLFLGANNKISYMGQTYSVEELLENLFGGDDCYGPKMLAEVNDLKSISADAAFKILDKEYLFKDVISPNVEMFKTIEKLQDAFPVK